MTNNRWVIRTRSNHILGPVSREKILELIANDAIHLDDELCSGNGYWFSLRENKLVQKYIKEGIQQSFNPVSEALVEHKARVKSGGKNNTKAKEITQVISTNDLQAEENNEVFETKSDNSKKKV